MILESIKALLTPSVSIDAKLKGVSVFIGKHLDKVDERLVGLESRQLQKGDKGDSVTVLDIIPEIERLHASHVRMQKDDLKELMENSWQRW